MTGNGVERTSRAAATRQLIIEAAERLFAERGVTAVSNRQVSEAAGQGNNTAVGYHFGGKADLVRAIVRHRYERVEHLREEMLEQVRGSREVRDWVSCLVLPMTRHLAASGSPTWFARFAAQAATEPAFAAMITEEALNSPVLNEVRAGLDACLPELPRSVRQQRAEMARTLMVHTVADRERALADGTEPSAESWDEAAHGLIDALTGMWTAPVTPLH
ncbi:MULTISPECIES: TetR/AcrR family transcriptional regulator [Prauserella salsuginis group]|uniref:AcrR family transcriptional regulator n=2 Tax=Prauserella salsuginis group TaxID=2893672 RepID=A0A839XFS7_9PSEU|nr:MULTISPECIES: TetR/AcrR family transcriptional regulator [Prauserella salsuginis group]MBB3661611.1 AcrR family transcriptional regulator [Prauserella sediminis]